MVGREDHMSFEDPDKLLKFKLGREEFCQQAIIAIATISKTKACQ